MNKEYKGAEWVRVDLHLHSPGVDSFILPAGVNLNSEEDRQKIIKQYVEKLKKANIKLAAITDYNGIRKEWFIPIKKEASTHEIYILPGVELSLEGAGVGGKYGLHLLIILEDNVDIDGFNTFLHSLDENPQDQLVSGRTARGIKPRFKLEEIINEIREKFNCLVIFPHPEGDKGIFKSFAPQDIAEYISNIKPDAIEFFYDQWTNKLQSTNKISLEELRKIAIIENSDPKLIDEIGNKKRDDKIRATYVKLSDFSLSALKLALHDPQVRVKLYQKPEMYHNRIKKILIDGTTFLKKIDIPFNPELNTFIGGRGVGKSAIIESIRYCLDLPIYSESLQKKEFVSVVVGSGGKIVVEIEKYHGKQKMSYTVERVIEKLPEVYDETGGKVSFTKPAEIFGEKSPLLIGQKELYEISQNEKFILQLIDQIIGDKIKETQKEFEELKNKLNDNGKRIIDLQRKIEKKNEYEQELKSIEAKIKEYEKLGVAEKLEKYTKILEDNEKINCAKQKFKDIIQEIDDVINKAKQEMDEIISSLGTAKSHKKNILEELAKEFEKVKTLIEKDALIKELSEIYERKIKKIIRNWDNEKEKEEKEIQDVKRKLGEKELYPEKFEEYTKRKAQIESLLRDFRRYEEDFNNLIQERKELKENAKKLRYKLFRIRQNEIEKINQKLNGKVKIDVIYEGNKKEFKKYISNLLKGSGLHESAINSLIETNEFTVDGILLSDLIAEGKEKMMEKFNLTEKMAERLIEYFKDRNKLFELETLFPDDLIVIELNVDQKFIPLDKLSPGQKATALLLLMFTMEDRILILDQPEEDLDNRFIYEDVVMMLRELKGKRQIITATHNANIPVIGDSELVIILEKQEGQCKIIDRGSVDKDSVKEHIKRIMEGGEEAFKRRAEKYGGIR